MIEFKPSKNEKAVITIRIDTEMLETVDKISGDVDISRNEFIIQCIGFALEHYPKTGSVE